MGIILILCLAACNNGVQDINKLPDNIGGGGNDNVNPDANAYLKFSFSKHPSSVFNATFVDEFDISDVNYVIVYTDGVTTTEVNGGPVTADMVADEDRALLSTVGHHMIRVSATLDNGKVATGSFALHLKDRSAAITLVTLTFDLKDSQTGQVAWAYFGSTDRSRNIATVQVEEGTRIDSWEDFNRIFRMALDGKALAELRYSGGSLSATQGFESGFEITKDTAFTGIWTDDVVNVSFDLALPSDASLMNGCEDPRADFAENGSKASQNVARNIGKIIAPTVDEFNVFNGYYFAGWYVNDGDGETDNDKLWSFSHTVGSENIALYAKWTQRKYSFTIYTTGGIFADDIKNSTADNDYPIDSAETAKKYGYAVAESSSRFGIADGALNRIILTGLKYGESFDKYVAQVTVKPQRGDAPAKTVFLKFEDIIGKLVKGSGEYVKIDGVYKDLQCSEVANIQKIESDANGAVNDIGYIKWVFNEPNRADFPTEADYNRLRYIRMSNYLTEVVFKDGITVKQDGSVRLDRIADWSVNELTIPASVLYDGQERPITEISEKACLDLKSMVTLDLSEAENLTTIGAQAFAHCSALVEIIMPENNSLSDIGNKAFYNTPFETQYSDKNGGLQFIVINNTLYKYVGSKDAVSLDLSAVEYYNEENCTLSAQEIAAANAQLNAIRIIASGAFEGCGHLESITLSDGVERINNYAFADLAYFKNITVGTESALKEIGELAFDGSAAMLSSQSNCYVAGNSAIIIGKVYYRFLDKTAASAKIPATVEYIAPNAFNNCGSIAKIEFLNEANIKAIGGGAFFSTSWVRQDDGANVSNGFAIVNGILAEYHNENYDRDNVNAVVPTSVKTIADRAFNSYSQYVKTIQLGTNVKSIGDYAFVGAASLESLIFTDMTAQGDRLVGAPEISEYSFLNSKGELIANVNFFVRQTVMDCIQRLAQSSAEISDETTKNWVNFYRINQEHFIVEDISAVWIDKDVVSDNLLKTGKTQNAFYDKYGMVSIANALVVVSNTGVVRRETLDPVNNDVQFVQVTRDNEVYGSLYEDGKNKWVITFTYHGETKGCALSADDANLYVATVTNAVSGVPQFYSSTLYDSNNSVIKADGLTSADNYWIEGFDGQVEGAALPTFYTSFEKLDARFGYKDINGDVCHMPVTVEDFSTSAEKRATAKFSVDFNGLGVYKFTIEYSVIISRYIDIEQTTAISLPLNGSATAYFAKYAVDLVGQDGLRNSVALNINNFTVLAVDGAPTTSAITTTLGVHTLTVLYTKGDAAEPIQKDIVYTVILDADNSLFKYEVINERAMTARIVECYSVAKNADTIVLPSTCVIDGKTYTVTEIGEISASAKGVFQNFTSLKAVYMSTTITKIGVNTFAGCTLLENVYTAQISDAGITQLSYGNFEDVRVLTEENGRIVKEVKLANLDGVEYGVAGDGHHVLAVAPSYEYTIDGTTIVCRIVKVNETLNVAFSDVEVFMPDTVYNKYSIFAPDETEGAVREIIPAIYPSGSGYMFRTEEYAPNSLTHIGASAFYNCQSLKNIDLTKASGLYSIGVSAFSRSALTEIDLSQNDKITELNNQCFELCANLVSVTLHGGIKAIGTGCFNGCISLENLNFVYYDGQGEIEKTEENVLRCEFIATDAFNLCTSLCKIVLTLDIQQVQQSAFTSCSCLVIYCDFTQEQLPATWDSSWNSTNSPIVWNCSSNDVANDGNVYLVVDGIRYAVEIDGATATVVKQKSSLTQAVIPATVSYNGKNYDVTVIDEFAFDSNKNLTKVTVTSSIKTIRMEAFSNCTSLVSFEFSDGNGLESVSTTAFEGCTSLENVPSSIK